MSIQEKAKHKKPLDDEKIIDLYWKRDEKAIDELFPFTLICNKPSP